MNKYDICVIGAGASGMIAGIAAKKHNKDASVLIIEKNERVGKKLINTGNGRCNISNADISAEHYYSSCNSYFDYFDGFSPDDTKNLFFEMGVLFKEEENGKIFPYSLQASSVLDAIRFECERLGVIIHCGERVKSAKRQNDGFSVVTDCGEYESLSLIVAAGGAASNKHGGCEDGYAVLDRFGHKCKRIYPTVTAVKTKTELIKPLKGIKADVNLTIHAKGNKKSAFGEILFTEYGLSGPSVLLLSQMLDGKADDAWFDIDFMPEFSFDEVVSLIKERKAHVYDNKLENFFIGMLNKRIGQTIIKSSGLELSSNASDLQEKQLRGIASQIKKFRLEITGVRGFEYAQVTGGGIELDKFDSATLQSKLCKGLFACGEVLDITGDCGGFNLQWAWTSGFKAGKNAASLIKR